MAVNAGVHVAPVSVSGFLEHFQKHGADIHGTGGNARNAPGSEPRFGTEKRGAESDTDELQRLLLEHLDRQDAVQSPG